MSVTRMHLQALAGQVFGLNSSRPIRACKISKRNMSGLLLGTTGATGATGMDRFDKAVAKHVQFWVAPLCVTHQRHSSIQQRASMVLLM